MVKLNKHNVLESLLILLLFALFMVVSLVLVSVGAETYQKVVANGDAAAQIRNSTAYLTNRVRSTEYAGRIEFLERDGLQILAVPDAGDSVTFVYTQDGYLKEFYGKKGQDFELAQGEPIARLERLTMEQTEKQLCFRLQTGGGTSEELRLTMR